MEDSVEHLIAALPVSRGRRKAIARELRSHIDEAVAELTSAGWPREDAEREGLRRLGAPEEIAGGFADVYRPARRRRRVSLAVGLAGVLLLGAYGSGSLASATSAHSAVTHAHTTSAVPGHHTSAPRTP